MAKATLAAVLTGLLATLATAQVRGPSPTSSVPPPAGDTFGTPTVATPGNAYGPMPGLKTPDTNSTLYVTGRVVMDGGGAPPEAVAIERMCVGSREVKGYTDSKGR